MIHSFEQISFNIPPWDLVWISFSWLSDAFYKVSSHLYSQKKKIVWNTAYGFQTDSINTASQDAGMQHKIG